MGILNTTISIAALNAHVIDNLKCTHPFTVYQPYGFRGK